MPAEWQPHAATWIGWPHNVTDWPGKFPPIPWVYGEIVRTLAPGEIVRILVNSALHQTQASRVLTKVGVDLARVDFLRFPTNRGWTRDFGPIFVRRSAGDLAIARFHFNAWAKYKDWKKDATIPERAAKHFKLPLIQGKIVLDGTVAEVVESELTCRIAGSRATATDSRAGSPESAGTARARWTLVAEPSTSPRTPSAPPRRSPTWETPGWPRATTPPASTAL